MELIISVDTALEAAPAASAVSGFRAAFGQAGGLSVEGAPDDLAVVAASSDIAAVGRRVGPVDVNTLRFSEKKLPESLVRRPSKCSLLDVAVGSGSVEMTKYLLEFHGAKPTRETLKQSLSTGCFELIKLIRERLPGAEFQDRVELLELAAEFHQTEVLGWLLRDATVFEGELLMVFALERKLADSLVVAIQSGFRPWWFRTRELLLAWRASSRVEFVSAPERFSWVGGWWTAVPRFVSALAALGCRGERGPTMPYGPRREAPEFDGEWTKAMSRLRLGEKTAVTLVVFPAGVTAIGEEALEGFKVLESVLFPTGCTAVGDGGLRGCSNLKTISFPAGCRAIGDGPSMDAAHSRWW
jgi:hypothetical protein